MTDPLRIYVAGPMSSANLGLFCENVAAADEAAKELFVMGHYPYCPHTMTQSWPDDERPEFHDYGRVVAGLDFAWLHCCDAILMLPGWQASKGAMMEYEEAQRRGITVYEDLEEVPCPTT